MTDLGILSVDSFADIRRLASKIGTVYFQIYENSPSVEFYHAIGRLEPHELVVELKTDRMDVLKADLANIVPGRNFFGAISGPWLAGYTDDLAEAGKVVADAREI